MKDTDPTAPRDETDYPLNEEAEFSTTSADWLTVPELIAIDGGDVTAESILRAKCAERKLDQPTDDEIAAFNTSVEMATAALRREVAVGLEQSEALTQLRDRLRSVDTSGLAGLQSELARASKSAASAYELATSAAYASSRAGSDSAAIRAAQRALSSPSVISALEAMSSSVAQEQVAAARKAIDLNSVGNTTSLLARISKPPFDQTSHVLPRVPSMHDAVREATDALVGQQVSIIETLSEVADLLEALVTSAGTTTETQRDSDRKQKRWNILFAAIYVLTLAAAIVAIATAN